MFGSVTQQPPTGLFGQAGTSAFGAAKPATGFGFNATAQSTTSMFGQNTSVPNTGQSSLFNQPNQSMFGATTTVTPAFGQTTANNQMLGTSLVKYQPLIGTDTLVKNNQTTSVATNQHCISAMKEYEAKSLEELRMEDYMTNRKGPQGGGTSGGLFGTPGPATTGLFGQPAVQQQQTAFGQPENKSVFGQPAQNTALGGFGQPNNTFGANTVQNAGLFKPFGTPATSAPAFAFNNPVTKNAPGSLFKPFGQQASNTNMFGTNNPTAAPTFGQSTSQPGFGQSNYGQTAPANQSIFGQTQDNKPNFGLAPTSAPSFIGFGANTNTGGSLFQPKPSTGFGVTGFGTATSTAPANAFGSFGNTNTFGAKPTVTTFGTAFGQQPAAAGTTTLGGALGMTGGMFGNQQQKSGGFFGSNAGVTSGSLFNSGVGYGVNSLGQPGSFGNVPFSTSGQSTPCVPIHQQILAMTSSPYGDNPIFKDLKPVSTAESLKVTNPAAQKAILESNSAIQFKMSAKSPGSGVKVKPVGNLPGKRSLFDGLEEYDISVDSFSMKPSARRLIIKARTDDSYANNSRAFVVAANSFLNQNFDPDSKQVEHVFENNIPKQKPVESVNTPESEERISWLQSNALEKVRQVNRSADVVLSTTIQELIPQRKVTDEAGSSAPMSSLDNSTLNLNETATSEILEPYTDHPTGIILRRVGYFTIPPLNELCSYLSEDGTCVINNFTVGREGYGNVYFDERMDVANLNLDEIVYFRNREVIIYPIDDKKPPVGTGLNRRAQVTLDQVWPMDKANHEPIKDMERLKNMDYEGKLRRACYKHDTKFIEYRPETGSWVFRVNHFSKYGLSDSDEEEQLVKKPKITSDFKMITEPKAEKAETTTQFVQQHRQTLVRNRVTNDPGLDDEDYFDESSVLPFTRGEITSPTSAAASRSGIDSHKLQLMKASLFVDDHCDQVPNFNLGRDSPEQMVPNRQLSRFSSMQSLFKESSVTSLRTMISEKTNKTVTTTHPIKSRHIIQDSVDVNLSLPIKLSPLVIRPKINQVRVSVLVLSGELSIEGFSAENCFADLGYLFRKNLKPSFGPQNRLTILTNVQDCEMVRYKADVDGVISLFLGRSEENLSWPLIVNLKICSKYGTSKFEQSVVEHLEIQLNCSTFNGDNIIECPQMKVTGSINLLFAHCEQALRTENTIENQKYVTSVWTLAKALWGKEDCLVGHDINSHDTIMRRRELLSQWLENVLLTEDMTDQPKTNYLKHLLDLLFMHKVKEACELALKNDDINLSLLLSQISSGSVVRQFLLHQLASWQDVETDAFIDPLRLKIYMLIAGTPFLTSVHGVINVFENVDWLTGLAINIWYLCSPTLSLTNALLTYERDFKTDDHIVAPPYPPYSRDSRVESRIPFQDIRYHLLQLYSQKSHRLETILNPATYTNDPMDFRLSWFLLQTLKSLGYQNCSYLSEAQLNTSFANQLEVHGLWQWAVFVLQHLNTVKARDHKIKEVLLRFIRLKCEADYSEVYKEREAFVLNKLGVPHEWINLAKAIRAGTLQRYHDQVGYFLKAREWSKAHEIMMQQIAPDAIINGK